MKPEIKKTIERKNVHFSEPPVISERKTTKTSDRKQAMEKSGEVKIKGRKKSKTKGILKSTFIQNKKDNKEKYSPRAPSLGRSSRNTASKEVSQQHRKIPSTKSPHQSEDIPKLVKASSQGTSSRSSQQNIRKESSTKPPYPSDDNPKSSKQPNRKSVSKPERTSWTMTKPKYTDTFQTPLLKPLMDIINESTVDEECGVCGEVAQDKYFGSTKPICESCTNFFKSSVLQRVTYDCKNDGRCFSIYNDQLDANICDFCRLNMCYQVGMNAELVEQCQEIPNYPRCYVSSEQNEIAPVSPTVDIDGSAEDDIDRLRTGISLSELRFREWLNESHRYQMMSENQKEALFENCKHKAVVTDIAFRSCSAHDVLNLGKSFLDPFKCTNELTQKLTSSLLHLTRDIRNMKLDWHSCANLKGSLVFMDDPYFFEVDLNHVREYKSRIQDMTELLEQFRESFLTVH